MLTFYLKELLIYKNYVIKNIVPEKFEFIKKNVIQFIYKEKSGTVTKSKLVKNNQKFQKNSLALF